MSIFEPTKPQGIDKFCTGHSLCAQFHMLVVQYCCTRSHFTFFVVWCMQ